MVDVAKAAGVSLQTVSRVVNNSGPVGTETRNAVETVIQQLGYQPNLAARTLAASSSKAIGLLMTGDVNFGFSSTFREVEHAARDRGFLLFLATASTPAKYERAVRELTGQGIAGLIVLARSSDVVPTLENMLDGLPCCLVLSGSTTLTAASYVQVDQHLGMEKLMRHLKQQGANSVIHVAGDRNWDDADLRAEAFLAAAQEIGMEGVIQEAHGWSAEAGYYAMQQILKGTVPDAIVACNDEIAMGVLRACNENELQVPQDLLLTGFDNTPLSQWTWPSLTSVRQDFGEIGREALSAMAKLLDGASPTVTVIRPELIVRESTQSW